MEARHCLFENALATLSKVEVRQGNAREVALLKTRLLIQLGRGKDAVEAAEAIPKAADPGLDADRMLAYGLALGLAGRLSEAENALAGARKKGADGELVESQIAVLRIQSGRLAEAEAILRLVLRRDPTLTGALYNLAVIRSRAGDVAEAAALLRQAWHSGYQNPDQLRSDPDLSNVVSRTGLIDDLLHANVPKCSGF